MMTRVTVLMPDCSQKEAAPAAVEQMHQWRQRQPCKGPEACKHTTFSAEKKYQAQEGSVHCVSFSLAERPDGEQQGAARRLT